MPNAQCQMPNDKLGKPDRGCPMATQKPGERVLEKFSVSFSFVDPGYVQGC